jgi:hypothetical protein
MNACIIWFIIYYLVSCEIQVNIEEKTEMIFHFSTVLLNVQNISSDSLTTGVL